MVTENAVCREGHRLAIALSASRASSPLTLATAPPVTAVAHWYVPGGRH